MSKDILKLNVEIDNLFWVLELRNIVHNPSLTYPSLSYLLPGAHDVCPAVRGTRVTIDKASRTGLNIWKHKTIFINFFLFARSHGLVVKGEDSQLSGCGFEFWHRILDGCERCQLLQLKINKK